MPYTRDDQIYITVNLDGTPYGASWDGISGGAGDSNTVKIRVNGEELDIGGPPTTEDLTLTIQMSDIVAGWMDTFWRRRGKGALSVGFSITDADYNPLVGPFTRTGTVKTCTPPDMNRANVSPAAANFVVVMSCNSKWVAS